MRKEHYAKTEIQHYIERAKRDLQATQINIEQGFYEVAISRAYYAMFYAANALLVSKGLTRNKHSGVVSAFGEYFVKTGIFDSSFAKMLGQTFDTRMDSDYDIVFMSDLPLVEAVQHDAERFVDQVEKYLQKQALL
ncbi:MAG: HEPN domain-containing protein [Caldilineaceae bacterium]